MTSDSDHIALIGAGRMGRGLANNLLKKGFRVTVYDVDPKASAFLQDLGADIAVSARAAAAQASRVITCLPHVESLRMTYLGPDGLLAGAVPGTLFIDTTSSSPALTRELGAQARLRGAGVVDAPLLRGAAEAWTGTLFVLLGGDEELKARARPVLDAVAEKVMDVGALGAGHALKALNNAVSMTHAVVIGEVFQAARRLGIAPETVVEVLSGGLGQSRMLELYGPRLVSGEHPRTGSIAFGEKDLGLFLDMARETHAVTPVLEAAYLVYRVMCSLDAGAEAPSKLADLLDGIASKNA